MNAYTWLAIHDAAAIGAGAYLATHNCPWWAALCFVMASLSTVKGTK